MSLETNGLPRKGHLKAVELMIKKEIIVQVRELEMKLGKDQRIYCRPTDDGLKCISTQIEDNNAMTGIVEEGNTKDFYFGPKKRLLTEKKYIYKSPRRNKDGAEGRFEAWLIYQALKNDLQLPDGLEHLLFVNSQWRFDKQQEEDKVNISTTKRGKQFLDLLAFDVDAKRFIVIELKKKGAEDRSFAKEQAAKYCAKLEKHPKEFSEFFLELLSNMILMYVKPSKQDKLMESVRKIKQEKVGLEFVPMAIEPISEIINNNSIVQFREI